MEEAPSAADGCGNERDRQRAQVLDRLSFLAAHPDQAEVVEHGAGCDPASGQVFASREYRWASLDARRVITFYQGLAAHDGWQPWPVSSGPGTTGDKVDPAAQGLGAFLCFTKQVGASPAFMELYFQDSSVHGPLGDVYDVVAWWPRPREPSGC
ncbi:hypothetical protein COUCH_11525 [Couchioplanes caeruleus]|uniref:hypothetical protein n=1 Tax=Couchioplanes caeruleus TaxID=56438 RepID=UPI0020BD7E26|nr:hypothetical protein [Couchioplanes caeruleus]UQU66852.1 hypothetical protein COUCH_11525 [Couchioplanes caeruleus]